VSRIVLDLDEHLHRAFLARARAQRRSPKDQALYELSLPLDERWRDTSRYAAMIDAHARSLAIIADALKEPPERMPETAATEIFGDDDDADEAILPGRQ
jgi:hypothetical protein